ncbi:hypothetical protein ASPZODRAFT_2111263 [Penicilliopsis zonata CBS 506.65]|uniref:Sulfatase N-terminal domain-containing protein n=1 Tax=Penicilliopsis zonata CBS 506.65 TaxID=1073090 RepID=A0A1L9SBN8_9EURO|nr:hypothetical protein ASPZODRAFT_2111263 [Penicilliopsis zonata CBS 506.65]OJJ44554.1 hypothetical protein ASPZODRAFT_2111263 [Penicilliopsis zonata CBS 506.65]
MAFSNISTPPLLFALLVVSGLASKTLHIFQHLESLPLLYLVIYLPTLYLPDVLVICLGRVLLLWPERRWQWLVCAAGAVLAVSSLLTWGASAIVFGFFLQTGAEVEWTATDSFVRDPAAMKLLMSGISTVCAAATVLLLVAWLIAPRLYSLTGSWMDTLGGICRLGVKESYTLLPGNATKARRWRCSLKWLIPVSVMTVSLTFLECTRPAVPWDHLSRALPWTLLDAFHTPSTEHCRPPRIPFPLDTDKDGKGHHGHHGHHPHHWVPDFRPATTDEGPLQRPVWLPDPSPPGFHRWDQQHGADFGYQPRCPGNDQVYRPYNALTDPLKVSNLGEDLLEPLQQVLNRSEVSIQHVVILTMESGRKELFPMQSGTPLYDALLESYRPADRDMAIDQLSRMTPVAQMVTGEYAVDSHGQRNVFNDSSTVWQDTAEEGMGGINVKGALTGSTLTFKSLLSSHCGVSPLPVDLLEEVNHQIYQPCLPQIFDLFNSFKGETDRMTGFQAQKWESVFVQAVTDTYDRQHRLNEMMGFRHVVTKETMRNKKAKYFPPKTEEINYFGYAENETWPYLADIIHGAVEKKNRLFLSHITSSTHHPWHTPEDFPQKQYTGPRGKHNYMNDYLNTIAYADEWLGRVLLLLDEAGIANETLVVIVGDHGQAFSEDSKMTGTFENPHISNFRVPLVFRHPHLPALTVSANVTSLSIVPTILDLLVESGSLDARDRSVASGLVNEYQGQSLLRPYQTERKNTKHSKGKGKDKDDNEVSLWNFGLINAGGAMISVTASNSAYRVILPLSSKFEYSFSNLETDPGEKHPLHDWTADGLLASVASKYGDGAAEWAIDAIRVGGWWAHEQKRIWDYRG